MERNITYALAAIKRLEKYRTGLDRFDAWIDYAIRDWQSFIAEQTAGATEPEKETTA